VIAPVATVPVLGSGRLVLFPGMRCTVHLRTLRSHAALCSAVEGSGEVAVLASRFEVEMESGIEHLHQVGTLAQVLELGRRSCCDRPVAELVGVARVRVDAWESDALFRAARCTRIDAPAVAPDERRLAFEIGLVARRIEQRFPHCLHVREVAERVAVVDGPEATAGAVAPLLAHLTTSQRQQVLELEPLSARLEAVLVELHERLARSKDYLR
jgi:ATP-dependent Lon protease